ncbi:hypothetical protein [Galbibacter pacificus]|uniref:Uncharacterized protein n=1 Tax=Galbibacter pacificus TaxID=2996052 RepID=A0ABT6FUN8_9FLAO|nr:hypothetical protein [Galbibacter pacificus]MDG3583547.1 hypothetical protein [Galbibacter pacificus]MDG3586977.1 hypothetical protein [Galbibacter pacificus]
MPNYKPNTEDLKLASLNEYYSQLVSSNHEVNKTEAALYQSMINCNEVLYMDSTGLFDLAKKVKAYVKSVYGGSSAKYNTISGIRFTSK